MADTDAIERLTLAVRNASASASKAKAAMMRALRNSKLRPARPQATHLLDKPAGLSLGVAVTV
jgi:hypothetical protein